MSTSTTNYGLVKPDGTEGGDFVDVGVINANMDTIDAQMKENELKGFQGTVVCEVQRGAEEIIATGVPEAILFDTDVTDPFNMHLAGGDAITINTSGFYMVNANIQWQGHSTARSAQLFKSSSARPLASSVTPGNADPNNRYSDAPIFWAGNLVAGDVLSLVGYQSSGGNLNAQGGDSTTPGTYLQLIRVI